MGRLCRLNSMKIMVTSPFHAVSILMNFALLHQRVAAFSTGFHMANDKPNGAMAGVTLERAHRLHRLVNLLSKSPMTRDSAAKKLRVDVRSFYRDLNIIRRIGLTVTLSDGKYRVVDPLSEALERLPFPDACLSIGEARFLARGRNPVHRKMKSILDRIEG